MSTPLSTQDRKISVQNLPQFQECSECGGKDCEWVSLSHWVALCPLCSGAHRNIPGSRVKSLFEQDWSQEEFQEMVHNVSNVKIKAEFEKYLPFFYQKPSPNCGVLLRNEFVRVKYVECQFQQADAIRYLTETTISLPRVLSNNRNSLVDCEVTIADRGHSLHISDKGGETKLNALCRLDRIDLCFVGASVRVNSRELETSPQSNKEHFMISYCHKNTYRFIYFNGRPDIQFRLLQTIRRLQFHLIKLNQSGMASPLTEKEMAEQLTPPDVVVGWLSKTGPRLKEQWRRRWCILLQKRLYYFIAPFDLKIRGCIEFSDQRNNVADPNSHLVTSIVTEMPHNCRTTNGFPLVLKSKKRDYVFAAEDAVQQKAWKDAFNRMFEPRQLHLSSSQQRGK